MKNADIKGLNVKELHTTLKEERMSLNKLILSNAVTPVETPGIIKETRKTIARILTEIKLRKA